MNKLNAANPRTAVLGRFVKDLASLSKCEDRKVAALVTNADGSQIYAIGVNGGPKGGQQCLCHLSGKYHCVHAEANALAKDKSSDDDKVMFITLGPCVTCASLMVNSGIKRVFYLEPWKNDDGIKLLRECGVSCFHLPLSEEVKE